MVFDELAHSAPTRCPLTNVTGTNGGKRCSKWSRTRLNGASSCFSTLVTRVFRSRDKYSKLAQLSKDFVETAKEYGQRSCMRCASHAFALGKIIIAESFLPPTDVPSDQQVSVCLSSFVIFRFFVLSFFRSFALFFFRSFVLSFLRSPSACARCFTVSQVDCTAGRNTWCAGFLFKLSEDKPIPDSDR